MFTKEIETDLGDNAAYWGIWSIEISQSCTAVEVKLGVWKNKQKYLANKRPYEIKRYVFSGGSFPFSNNRLTNVLEDIRAKILENDTFFVDAVLD